MIGKCLLFLTCCPLYYSLLHHYHLPTNTTKAKEKNKARPKERERERASERDMDLDWVSAFFKNNEWLIVYLKGMLKPAAALAVVLLAVALSYSQNLSLEGEMIYSVFRSFLQLSVIGFILQFIFNQENAGWIILAYLFMVSYTFKTPTNDKKLLSYFILFF